MHMTAGEQHTSEKTDWPLGLESNMEDTPSFGKFAWSIEKKEYIIQRNSIIVYLTLNVVTIFMLYL